MNGAADSAEDMGLGLAGTDDVICQDDGICTFAPAPGSGPGTDLSDFVGEDVAGDWMLCVGDSAAQDTGQICPADFGSGISLDVQSVSLTEVPTASTWGLIALLGLLAGAGVMVLRR